MYPAPACTLMSRRVDSSVSARAGARSVRVKFRLMTTSVVTPISCILSGAMLTMPLLSTELVAMAGTALVAVPESEAEDAGDFNTGTKSMPQIGHFPLGSCERTKGCIVQV